MDATEPPRRPSRASNAVNSMVRLEATKGQSLRGDLARAAAGGAGVVGSLPVYARQRPDDAGRARQVPDAERSSHQQRIPAGWFIPFGWQSEASLDTALRRVEKHTSESMTPGRGQIAIKIQPRQSERARQPQRSRGKANEIGVSAVFGGLPRLEDPNPLLLSRQVQDDETAVAPFRGAIEGKICQWASFGRRPDGACVG